MNNTSPELRDALNAPLQQSGLTFTVQAAPFRHTQKEASVALAIEFDGASRFRSRRPTAAGWRRTRSSCRFSASIRTARRSDRRGRSSISRCGRSRSRASKPAGFASIRGSTLEPGRYQIRVGARESVGSRVGTVFYDLQVPDFRKEPLMLSGMLVTAASAQAAMTAMPDPAAPKLLPDPPSAAGRSPETTR